jgi:hypothetical protein
VDSQCAALGKDYRTLEAVTVVKFELVERKFGLTARNVEKQENQCQKS